LNKADEINANVLEMVEYRHAVHKLWPDIFPPARPSRLIVLLNVIQMPATV
jgi:hypothetical protein